MTATSGERGDTANDELPEGFVRATIDDTEIAVPEGTLVIRAAELAGIAIPRFCDHPLLEPVGACRQCLVDVEGQRKPLASCTAPLTDGMVVRTQFTSEVAERAQRGVMELLLVNHPLDCPVCDKGGECPLQNQAMTTGNGDSRFHETKRTYPKPIPLSAEILLDRERCVLCARCTRFSQQIAGDPMIELLERGALEQVGVYGNEPFSSYFSGNTVQICPVGALTSADYRFRARPFDLVSTPSACEHCASGCAQRTDHRRGKVTRRLAGDDPEVNEEWNCDKGRFAFRYATERDRLTTPLVRATSGELEPASWPYALAAAADGLRRTRARAGVLVGGRSTVEDAYAYAKFARVALGTNDIDFRARAVSPDETRFLASYAQRTGGPTYRSLEHASSVLLVGFEPEEESPIVFLRLRKAVRRHGLRVTAIAPFTTPGLQKLDATVLATVPGRETATLGDLPDDALDAGGVIVVGERLASVPGGLAAAQRLAERMGAGLAWIPRRAGDRGALGAGAFPTLLPGGHPLSEPAARAVVEQVWGEVPETPGRAVDEILAWNSSFVVGGVDPYDLPDATGALAALADAEFVVSLELRPSAVTEHADVVFPVAAVAEKTGTFVDWEGRPRSFEAALSGSAALSDLRVLDALARAMGTPLALPDADAARTELARIGRWHGTPATLPATAGRPVPVLDDGEAILATWPLLLGDGRMLDGEHELAQTARATVARLSPSRAAALGVTDGDPVTVATGGGAITAPAAVTDMPDDVVWLPTNSPGSHVHAALGVTSGARVTVTGGEQ
ncbi:NADH-quinone oxidoreductase subunit G [Rhodococcus rhodnii]|uniref:NADH-quinone oxidoreductase n=2 Tax=Rhodococcus rhodnii TaxID=38312 RepID=R7WK98_9NOCA|nr:NADH-quinone oxidoreductase subunit G [Rhodococcus rhodnii]EOM75722.1 NADH dehydrogenase subunit G [Rhodococcus rhodnii LMG 5362]TXG92404.1 NADH-quinone oxidoreductase subunit G [Rhodococcus rhodnii]